MCLLEFHILLVFYTFDGLCGKRVRLQAHPKMHAVPTVVGLTSCSSTPLLFSPSGGPCKMCGGMVFFKKARPWVVVGVGVQVWSMLPQIGRRWVQGRLVVAMDSS